jgi:hypothetical protein
LRCFCRRRGPCGAREVDQDRHRPAQPTVYGIRPLEQRLGPIATEQPGRTPRLGPMRRRGTDAAPVHACRAIRSVGLDSASRPVRRPRRHAQDSRQSSVRVRQCAAKDAASGSQDGSHIPLSALALQQRSRSSVTLLTLTSTSRPARTSATVDVTGVRRCSQLSVERDDDFAVGAALLGVCQRLEGLVEWECLVDDRAEVAGVVEGGEFAQLGAVGLHE